MEYNRFTLRDADNNELWSMTGIFSYPQIAGLIVGGNSCLYEIPIYNGEYFETTVRLKVYTLKDLTVFRDDSIQLLIEKVPRSDISRNMTLHYMGDKEFALWIYNDNYEDDVPLLDLYGFDNDNTLLEFLQAILTITFAFNVPSDNIIANTPLRMDGSYRAVALEQFTLTLPLLPNDEGGDRIYPIEGETTIYAEVPPLIFNPDYYDDRNDHEDTNDDYDPQYGGYSPESPPRRGWWNR